MPLSNTYVKRRELPAVRIIKLTPVAAVGGINQHKPHGISHWQGATWCQIFSIWMSQGMRTEEKITHRRMLPVKDDFRNVFGRVQEMIIPPLIPVYGHCTILVHAAKQENNPKCYIKMYSHKSSKGQTCTKHKHETRQGGRHMRKTYLLGDRTPAVASPDSDSHKDKR